MKTILFNRAMIRRWVRMALLGVIFIQPIFCGADTPDPEGVSASGAAEGAPWETEAEDWNAKFQTTYIWQGKRAFPARYSGEKSLRAAWERSYTFTSTAHFGFRPWQGGEIYFNPEAVQGVPLSDVTGLGGFTNGEISRTAGPEIKVFRARLFLRQTWGQGGGREKLESDANQLAGAIDRDRIVLTVGNLSILDIFDDNIYSHDPRTQFLNWALMTHGAFDYAADMRGYSWGMALEWYRDNWAVRAGRFLQPYEPNELPLDPKIHKHFGDQFEIERAHHLAGQPGKVRFLAFRNRARMSSFQDALNWAKQTGQKFPEINDVRYSDKNKIGFGINIEQAVSNNMGLFFRGSWADGKTEAYAFTEIDRSLTGGTVFFGRAWGRPEDTLGLAVGRNTLSRVHRDYLAAGGCGFFICDRSLDGNGNLTRSENLNYRPETLFEAYYNLHVGKKAWLALNWQRIGNPAYNADRGPVKVISLRFHAEY